MLAEKLGTKDVKKIAGNTWLERRDNGIALKLHKTDILFEDKKGNLTVNTGGWWTMLTKNRLNDQLRYFGYTLFTDKGVWYWKYGDEKPTPFVDGDRFVGGVLKTNAKAKDEAKRVRDLTKRIKKYAEACASAVPLEQPGGGDCPYCAFILDSLKKPEKSKSIGWSNPLVENLFKDPEHLVSHMEENYIVPSLVVTALKTAGETDYVISGVFYETPFFTPIARDRVKRDVVRYMKRSIGVQA